MMTTESIRASLSSQEEAYLRLFDNLLAEGVAVDPVFFAAIGRNYAEANLRILLIGKATAGWYKEEIPAQNSSDFFRRQQRHSFSDEFLDGGGKKSDFWRFATNLNQIARSHVKTTNIDMDSGELSLIAWSNLFKIGGQRRNPTPNLQSRQHIEALALLRAELTALEPHLVVFVTESFCDELVYQALGLSGGSGDGFSEATDGQSAFYYRDWMGDNYPAVLWVQHPQFKPRARVGIWLDKAKELLVECDRVRSESGSVTSGV